MDKMSNKRFKKVMKKMFEESLIFKMADGESFVIRKFNPYHDQLGRFTTPQGAISYNFRAKDNASTYSHAVHDKANEREKKKEVDALIARVYDPKISFGERAKVRVELKRLGVDWRKEKPTDGGKTQSEATKRLLETAQGHEDNEATQAARRALEKRGIDWREVNALSDKPSSTASQTATAEQAKAAELERAYSSIPELSREAASHANSASFFDHGDGSAREALSRFEAYKERHPIKEDWTDEQKAYAQKREEAYRKLLAESYNDEMRRWGDNPSTMVTGRANYNVNRANKKMQAYMNSQEKYSEKLKAHEENTKKGLERLMPEDKQIDKWRQGKWDYGESISADDPLATKKLQAKLEYLNKRQTQMKQANAHYRKNGTMKGFAGLNEKEAARMDQDIKDSRLGTPYASFSLSNNNAQIKATQQRLKQLEKPKTNSSGAEANNRWHQGYKGGRIVENASNNRLQIIFEGKPDEATRAALKANGFKWAPSQGAWQRQLTDNARWAMDRMVADQ